MKAIQYITGKKMIVLIGVVLFLSAPAFSQQPALAAEENSPEIQVKYLAGDNEAMLFNLKYGNTSGSAFKLMVLNETGDVLFQDNYSGRNFKKRLRLTRLTDTEGVTFLIRPAEENVQLSYKVKVKKKVMDGLAISNMN